MPLFTVTGGHGVKTPLPPPHLFGNIVADIWVRGKSSVQNGVHSTSSSPDHQPLGL